MGMNTMSISIYLHQPTGVTVVMMEKVLDIHTIDAFVCEYEYKWVNNANIEINKDDHRP